MLVFRGVYPIMGIPIKPVFHGKYPAFFFCFFRGSLGGSPLLRLENSRNVVVAAACPCGPALEIRKTKRYPTSVIFYGFYHGEITIQVVKNFENVFRKNMLRFYHGW